jgi:hypothetical protein
MTEVEAIHHITEATMADDPKKAVNELDRAAELIDEMAARLAEESKGEGDEPEPESKAEGEGKDEPESEGEGNGEPESEGEGESVREKAGKVGETVKGAAPPTPLVLAGLGIVAGLAVVGAVKALSGTGSE